MVGMRSRILPGMLAGVGLTMLFGCFVAADLVNPAVWVGLGIDQASVSPQAGKIVVAMSNTTRYSAVMLGFYSEDAVDLTRNSRNFAVQVAAGEVKNEVLDCPVGLLSPGQLEQDYSVSTLAAVVTVTTTEGTDVTEVDYEGPAVNSATAYKCGDVVEFRLSEAPAAADEQGRFIVSIRVIPGR